MKAARNKNKPDYGDDKVKELAAVVADVGPAIVACSGGVDSLLLATVYHRTMPSKVIIAHAVSPAVVAAATERVKDFARAEGWRLKLIDSGEFDNPVYRANPVDRCYYCKSCLYNSLSNVASSRLVADIDAYTMVSGANVDDLGEFRPGLAAAEEFKVRHPFIEAGMTKQHVRAMSRDLGLSSADLPASPCLASRLYTGTRVTKARLAAVEHGEEFIKGVTGVRIVRCRIRGNKMYIEVRDLDRHKITAELLDRLLRELHYVDPDIETVTIDPLPYRPGRAFVSSP